MDILDLVQLAQELRVSLGIVDSADCQDILDFVGQQDQPEHPDSPVIVDSVGYRVTQGFPPLVRERPAFRVTLDSAELPELPVRVDSLATLDIPDSVRLVQALRVSLDIVGFLGTRDFVERPEQRAVQEQVDSLVTRDTLGTADTQGSQLILGTVDRNYS